MMQNITALILAGGFATRLWPLTEKRAKPLLPLAGKPLLQHTLEKIPPEIPIIISTNQAFYQDFLTFHKLFPNRTITISVEDSNHDKGKVGALAAIALILKQYRITSPLLTITGDNLFGFDFKNFFHAYHGKTLITAYDCKSINVARQCGVISIRGKQLVSFTEKPRNPSSTLISTGCYIFSPEHLSMIQEYANYSPDHLGSFFEYLLKKNEEVEVFCFEQFWADVGSFENYLQAHHGLMKQNRISPLSRINSSKIGDAVYIEDHCFISDSFLENVIILEQCTINDCHLRNCVIDRNCVISGVDLNHKMIREGTIIGKTS